MGFSCKQAGALLAIAACAPAANAEGMTFDFSGFGTAGVAWTDTNYAQFARDSQPTGADSSVDIGLDSLVAVQGTVHLTSSISAITQVMFRRSDAKGFTLDVPLAFLKDAVTQDFAVRVGRLQLPTFMISESRQVGFANTFVRPPVEVYAQSPLDYVDGVDGQYAHSFGPFDIAAGAFYGKVDLSLTTAEVTVRKLNGANISATWGPVTLHYGRVTGRITIASAADQLIAAVGATGFTQLADQLATVDRATSFSDLGLSLDWHNFLVQGETTQSKIGGYVADTRGRYALVGYRIQKFTPYVSYAVRKVISPTTDSTIPQVGPLLPLALGVDALLAAYSQHTTSFGVRWDFHDSLDAKLQIDHVSPEGPGLFINVKPGFSGPVTVAALVVDFVF
jgi:hypothetical protein